MSIRVALAQVDTTVGNLEANAVIIIAAVAEAAAQGADLVVLPEMALTGYPIEDLALRSTFQRAASSATRELAQTLETNGLGQIAVVVGTLVHAPEAADSDATPTNDEHTGYLPTGGPRNAAVVMQHGQLVATYAKHHLPNYGVFDEARTFTRGNTPLHLHIGGALVTIGICEDLWQEGGPVTWAREAASSLLLVLNASPYEAAKDDRRLELCRARAAEANCTLAYVNLIGGQDELVFDGGSMVVSADGALLARAPQFTPSTLLVDLDLPPHDCASMKCTAANLSVSNHVAASNVAPLSAQIAPELDDLEEIYGALVLGLGDYVVKNHFRGVLLGMSGGIDSALVAAIAADAIGAEHVFGVSMPSEFSSEHSKDDAADSAARMGMHLRTVAIAPMVDAYQDSLHLTGLASENLQARVRGTLLMGISNAEGLLVLTTGNKSELSVGYSTLYGDSVGGFAPIKDVPKTLVWELARWRNRAADARGEAQPIPESSIEKPPSAELRPGQQDSDSLPDYVELDAVLQAYVGHDRGAADLVQDGFESALVDRIIQLTDAAEYKRRQGAPGTKISLRAFGRDRRLPITNGWREPRVD